MTYILIDVCSLVTTLIFSLLLSAVSQDLTTNEVKSLVVIHDRWIDLSPDGSMRHEDIHTKSTIEDVALNYNLQVIYINVPRNVLIWENFWQNPESVVGIISIGACTQNAAVMSLRRPSDMAVLLLNTEPCPTNSYYGTNMLPLYRVKIMHRYQCLRYIIGLWLTVSRHQVIEKSDHSYISLFPNNLEVNLSQEYLDCAGSDLLEADEIDPEFASPEMKVELGKVFLNSRKLIVATIQRPPFAILEMSGDVIVDAKGFCYEMLNTLAQEFNFTYSLLPPYDGNWGGLMPNGSFNGMVGMVQRKEVDLALASITITYIRESVIDFTHAFYEEPTAILVPPPTQQNNFLAFLDPFSWLVWLLTLCSVILVGTTMWLLSIVGSLPLLHPHDKSKRGSPLLRYLWDCAFALTTQGNKMKQTEPVRVLNGIWWFVCIIFIYTYTGNLIAFLTVPSLGNVIKSLEELANQRKILWTYRSNSAHEMLFASAPPPSTYHKIGQLLTERPELFVMSDNDGVEAVLGGKTAFLKEKSWLDFAMERDYLTTKKCRLYQVRHYFFSAGYGCVLQENAVYLQLFNDRILRMMQSGLFAVWRRKYWPKPNECSNIRLAASGPKALDLGNFSGHFFIFGVGLSMSIVVLVMENIYHSCCM